MNQVYVGATISLTPRVYFAWRTDIPRDVMQSALYDRLPGLLRLNSCSPITVLINAPEVRHGLQASHQITDDIDD
jgi:hypothetical protein